MDKYYVRELSKEELDSKYGNKKIDIGRCFLDGSHYYMQRLEDVLHINGLLINSIHVASINLNECLEITNKDFELKIKETIYLLEIDKFWNNG